MNPNRIMVPLKSRELHKSGEFISECTVGKYMKQMGIKAQWVKTMDHHN